MEFNVLGSPLVPCSMNPRTGYYRDGCCRTGPEDVGRHTVCVVLTQEFLLFSQSRGNDLLTPHPEYGFPGLKEGDRWCLCAARWQEAFLAGMAPYVILESTHHRALEIIALEDMQRFAFQVH